MIVLYSLAIFLGASLLFLVQPLAAKRILPMLGGSPAVWNTCLVFYQAVLLAGYAYAHAITRLKPRTQVVLHAVVLVLAFGSLLISPLAPPETWEAPTEGTPIFWLLGLLGVMVALPFFAVSSASPLLQAWLARTNHRFADDPYFLYAASNAGSLLGLLAYPLLLEPNLRLDHQAMTWIIGFGLFIPLALTAGGLMIARPATEAIPETPDVPADAHPRNAPITWARRLKWIVLAAIPSSLMIGATHHITMDIAAVPFLWVLPLALYLITFILAFSTFPMPPVGVLGIVFLVFSFLAIGVPLGDRLPGINLKTLFGADESPIIPITLHLFVMFSAAFFAHRWLAKDRPPVSHLTQFYLLMSTGGVIGGAFNALAAPFLFDTVLEYPIVICVGALTVVAGAWLGAAGPLGKQTIQRLELRAAHILAASVLALAVIGACIIDYRVGRPDTMIHVERTFFGVHKVGVNDPAPDDPSDPRLYHELAHGTTIHGAQWREPPFRRRFALLYHNGANGCGRLLQALIEAEDPRSNDVAITGLGVGGLAAYAQPGDRYVVYEIDPAVDRIAENEDYFTYLDDARRRGAEAEVIIGDGRLKMAEAEDDAFGVIILDAFSSDAVPVHLLTAEALQICKDKLQPGGVIAVNVTNRYLDLRDAVAATARSVGLRCYQHAGWPGLTEELIEVLPYGRDSLAAQWLFLVENQSDLLPLIRQGDRIREINNDDPKSVWTDDYSNLLATLKALKRDDKKDTE